MASMQIWSSMRLGCVPDLSVFGDPATLEGSRRDPTKVSVFTPTKTATLFV